MRSRRRDREHVAGGKGGDSSSTTSRGGDTSKRSGGGGGGRGQGGRSQGGGKGRNKSKRSRNSRGGSKGTNKGQSPSGAGFWGDAAKLPAPTRDVRITEEPAAVARSLGAPPLPGHENIAEHYFTVVYERAVQTAGALAAAGGLIDPDALAEELGE